MKPGNLICQGKPKPGAMLFSGTCLVHHIESLCDAGKILLRHAAAIIPDTDVVFFSRGFYFSLQLYPGCAGFYGIVCQVDQQSFQQVVVCKDIGRFCLKVEIYCFLPEKRGKPICRILQQFICRTLSYTHQTLPTTPYV